MLLDWPTSNSVVLGALSSAHVSTVEMLGLEGRDCVTYFVLNILSLWSSGTQLKFSPASNGLLVNLPVIPPSLNLKWTWTLKINLQT